MQQLLSNRNHTGNTITNLWTAKQKFVKEKGHQINSMTHSSMKKKKKRCRPNQWFPKFIMLAHQKKECRMYGGRINNPVSNVKLLFCASSVF